MEYDNAINSDSVKRREQPAPLYTAGYGQRHADIRAYGGQSCAKYSSTLHAQAILPELRSSIGVAAPEAIEKRMLRNNREKTCHERG
jgi:hypothetical protein